MGSRSLVLVVVAGFVLLVVLPPVIGVIFNAPPRSVRRLVGWALGVACLGLVAAAAAGALAGGLWWLPGLVVGVAGATALLVRAARRNRQRREEDQGERAGVVSFVPARVRVRPHRDERVRRGSLAALDRWQAADGPEPTAGWWTNGGLVLDDFGPALLDAAALRHQLPASTAGLVRRRVPRELLLTDRDGVTIARLPVTGFDEGELRRLAAEAGWEYLTDLREYRLSPDFTDLRGCVQDAASRDRRVRVRHLLHRRA